MIYGPRTTPLHCDQVVSDASLTYGRPNGCDRSWRFIWVRDMYASVGLRHRRSASWVLNARLAWRILGLQLAKLVVVSDCGRPYETITRCWASRAFLWRGQPSFSIRECGDRLCRSFTSTTSCYYPSGFTFHTSLSCSASVISSFWMQFIPLTSSDASFHS